MSTKPSHTPREELSEQDLKAALDKCDQEPIHIPNLIQPHGCLFVVDKKSDKVVQVSQNVEQFLNKTTNDCLGKTLDKLFGKEQAAHLNEKIREYDLQPLTSALLEYGDHTFDAVMHYSGNYKILELEFCRNDPKKLEDRIYEELRSFSILAHQADDLKSLYNVIVDEIRALTGFARVKLYKFDEEWNGMVVAESRQDHMPSYLNLNFPASDIPAQARRLYTKSYLRLIADIRYKPIGLTPEIIKGESKPIDMSFSILRSVSPIHIQYLDNINVMASMSISIIQDGQLWGLIACHHDESLHVPYRERVLSEIIGHMFSAKLSSMEMTVRQHRAAKKSLLIEKISAQINGAVRANDILYGNHEIAMEALSADGLIIRTGEKIHTFGDTPNEDILNELIKICLKNFDNNIFYTRNARKFLENLGSPLSLTGGFLAVSIGRKCKDIAIWFRSAKQEKVNWAGNPEKPVENTKAGYRLTPRSSFALWQQETAEKSDSWHDEDIEAAESIAEVILENEKLYAERANEAKSEFLSHMSHELRTPLGAVTGIVHILNKDNTLTEKQKELINTLRVSADSLLDLINDLLDIAKIEAHETELETIPFSLSQILEDIRSMMKVKAGEKGLALNVNYDREDKRLFIGDPSKIKQILINLVNNSIKFTGQGFVNVLAEIVETDKDHASITFEVVDSGIGIDESRIDSIFEKFVQANSSITRQYGGTGLGLAITKSLVELMDGEISVTSKEGMGSKFSFTLPLRIQPESANDDIAHKKSATVQAQNKADKKKILLVEDYEGNIVVALYHLQEEGYDVVIAKNGKEAIRKIENHDFDVIIMDVQMPIMDGLTATRIIKEKQESGEFKPTPIVGMTANALKEDRQKCLDAGMDDYISKPLEFTELSQKLERWTADKSL